MNQVNALQSKLSKKDVTFMCPRCYDIVTIGDVDINVNISTSDPRVNPTSVVIAQNGIFGGTDTNVGIINMYCQRCDVGMIEIDVGIAGAVQAFNKIGLLTKYSCEGHYSCYGINPPYVMFFDMKPLLYLFENRIDMIFEGVSYNIEERDIAGIKKRFGRFHVNGDAAAADQYYRELKEELSNLVVDYSSNSIHGDILLPSSGPLKDSEVEKFIIKSRCGLYKLALAVSYAFKHNSIDKLFSTERISADVPEKSDILLSDVRNREAFKAIQDPKKITLWSHLLLEKD